MQFLTQPQYGHYMGACVQVGSHTHTHAGLTMEQIK